MFPGIKSATIQRLVDHLSIDTIPDDRFRDIFLLTYRTFMSPSELSVMVFFHLFFSICFLYFLLKSDPSPTYFFQHNIILHPNPSIAIFMQTHDPHTSSSTFFQHHQLRCYLVCYPTISLSPTVFKSTSHIAHCLHSSL